MNKRTLRILEYNKILEMLSEHANSDMAKRRCTRMKPQTDISRIEELQSETRDALLRINFNGNLSFAGLRDIGASLKLLSVHSALSQSELLSVADLLGATANAKHFGDNVKSENSSLKSNNQKDNEINTPSVDSLTKYFAELRPLEYISTEIRRCIMSEEDMFDDASTNLKRIRREIDDTNQRLHQQLAKLTKNDDTRSYLQENLVTMRNGRYCIPVKQEYRSHFPGMIHDQSGSGSTLFIEPMEIVNLNNKIKELQTEEHMEIEKILASLSELCSSAIEDITINFETLSDLDFIFARAKFARSYTGVEPIFNTDGIIDIKQGRHPLLEKHTVVPVDIKLGDDYTLLIVTGPNTGGKTVSLKTLGLFTLMGQAGLHIPALHGSRLAVFNDVFADIGDEQSIEQNLSTFSSHMSNIVYIVNHASENTLCLFDEPGGGTDPVEGAALAISILNYLKDLGARCMATTHYSELKTYALTANKVMNASCEFDVATLRPTYKLMIGIPGKSNAFAISKKLGLPDYIIDSAAEQIDSSAVDMESLIASLEDSKKQIEEDKQLIESYKKDAEILKKRLEKKESDLDDKKKEILEKARAEAREIVENAKEVADETIRDYNKWRTNPNKADLKKMEEKRAGLRKKIDSYETKKKAAAPVTSGHTAKDFKIGDAVHVISMDIDGTISTLPDKNGVVTVHMGIMKSKINISDLIIIKEDSTFFEGNSINNKPKRKYSNTGYGGFEKALNFNPEINLIGKTVDEALSLLDKFLDDAMLAQSATVRIVHGKGSGTLRKAIHTYLKKQKSVKSFDIGEYGEGDAGVTVVKLK